MNPPEVSGVAEAAPVVPPAAAQDGPRATRRKPVAANGPTTYEAAYPELHRVAYRAAYRITQNRQRAEDVAQEAMVRAYLKWNKLHDQTYRNAFVARVASNLAIGAIRRQATVRKFASVLAASAPEARLDNVDGRLQLQEALRTLPKRQREVVMLRVLADQSEADTAAVLGLPISTVRYHLAVAIEALRDRAVGELVAQDVGASVGSAAHAAEVAARRRATQRKVRGTIAGIIAFVVAAIGSGLFGLGVVRFQPDEANDKRNQVTTTTTTVVPAVPSSAVTGGDSVPIVPPVGAAAESPAPGGSEGRLPGGALGGAAPGCSAGATVLPGSPSDDRFAQWPNAANTGVPVGQCVRPSGSITVTQRGTVLDGLDVTGCIIVRADDVTIRRSRIAGGCATVIENGGMRLLIEDVEVSGRNTASACIGYGNYTARRVNLHNCSTGAMFGDETFIEYSYIHDLFGLGSGAATMGGANAGIRFNNIDNRSPDGVAAVRIAVDNSAKAPSDSNYTLTRNIRVEGNRLNGGGFTVYGGAAGRPGEVNASDISIINNTIGPDPKWGALLAPTPGLVWSGNVWEVGGAPV